jgi:cell division septation protein DedD
MAENRRDRDKRFYFSRGQLVLLGGAFALASLIIFFLGIVVGRGIEERKMARPEEPLIKIPVNPSAQGSGAGPGSQAKEELTFYDTLAKSSNSGSSPEDKASEPTQPERVIKSERKEIKAKGRETPAPVSLRTEERPPAEKAPLSNRVEESGRAWYVQVNAFPDERSGKVSVDRLKNKGYNAYLTEARNKGKLWYRVRVGEFRTREEAERIADILKSKENFPSAFATRQ